MTAPELKVSPADLRVTRRIGWVLSRGLTRLTVTGTLPDGPVLVVLGEPVRLPAARASRRTVAAAADEIHRTLAAHVAATRPHPKEQS